MVCNKCNNEVPYGSKFCNICGTKLEEMKVEELKDTTENYAVSSVVSDSITANIQNQSELDKKVTVKKKNFMNKSTFVVVLIIVAAIYAFIYVNNYLVPNKLEANIVNTFNEKKWDKVMDLINDYEKVYASDEKIRNMLSLASINSRAETLYKDANGLYQNKNYEGAYKTFIQIDKNADIYTDAVKKQEELSKIIIRENLSEAKKAIGNKDYLETFRYLGVVLQFEPNNEEAITLQKKYQKQYDTQMAEYIKKAEAEAKKKADAEAAKYAPKKIVDKNGKQIWKIYIGDGSLHFTGTYKGSGNFIVKLSDSNQDLIEVIANEIGDFISDKTVIVPYIGWYYLEVYGSDGSWEYEWK